jgi:DNA primase (EC 2.7.7.-)
MDDTTKYLIHARIAANGIVERSDVVGAVFGQTEGLLGDELDLRDLQQSSKVGRIDVEISSENGQSFGELTIATSLGKAETAILAASLETINRVGPCQADIEVTAIEDIRAAKRREIVDRAKELLSTAFDESGVSGADLVDDVRDSARVADVADYEGLPAGPRIEDSDAVIIVEGRADVRQLLAYGIKNAIAVEGTDIPDAVADLTADRTTTVFVDGDRGGELILRELLQVGEIDFVAFAPPDRSVEDLSRTAVLDRLRQKVIADRLRGAPNVREAIADIIEETADRSGSADNRPRSGDDTQPPAADADADTAVEVVPTSSPAASPSAPSESPPGVSADDPESRPNTAVDLSDLPADADAVDAESSDAESVTADADVAAAATETAGVDTDDADMTADTTAESAAPVGDDTAATTRMRRQLLTMRQQPPRTRQQPPRMQHPQPTIPMRSPLSTTLTMRKPMPPTAPTQTTQSRRPCAATSGRSSTRVPAPDGCLMRSLLFSPRPSQPISSRPSRPPTRRTRWLSMANAASDSSMLLPNTALITLSPPVPASSSKSRSAHGC